KNKQSLDTIGQQLVKRGAVTETELDRIVENDDLFAGVMKRISTTEFIEVRSFSWGMGAAYASVSLAVAVVATVTIFSLMRTANVPQVPSIAAVSVPAPE